MTFINKYIPKIYFKINKFIFTKNYQISYFKGGFESFGNNIQQIALGILYCNLNNYNFYLKGHPYINDFKVINNSFNDRLSFLKKRYRFFYFDKPVTNFYDRKDYLNKAENDFPISENDKEYYINNIHETVQKFIKPNLHIYENVQIGKETLVIHIRSGDIFKNNWHSMYVQNPVSYFEKLMEKFEKVIIVTSDYANPVINILAKYEKVKILTGTFKDDLNILLNAQNLASSGVGTFVVSAAMLSKKIENFFCSQYYLNEHLNPTMLNEEINVNFFNIKEYIEIGDFIKNKENFNKLTSNRIRVDYMIYE